MELFKVLTSLNKSTIFLGCIGAWLCQCYLVNALPEVADEAYYTRWGELLSWGYFDHPPAVALWAKLGGRYLNLLLLPLAWLNFSWSAQKLGSKVHQEQLLLVAWCTPLGLASGVLVTPDAPLLFSWSIALLGLAHKSVLLCIMGFTLGLWSKAMILPAMLGLLWLWWTDENTSRKKRRLQVLLISLVSFALYTPHLIWSFHHHWLPWQFQMSRPRQGLAIFDFLGGQLAVGGGLWFIYLVILYYIYVFHLTFQKNPQVTYQWKKLKLSSGSPTQMRNWWWLSAPSFFPWLLLSLVGKVEANWTALAWPIGLVWVLESVNTLAQKKAFLVSLCFTIPCLCLPLIHHFIPLSWGPPRDGKELAKCLESISRKENKNLWLLGRYQEAALLGLSLKNTWKSVALNNDQFLRTDLATNDQLKSLILVYLRGWERRSSQYDLMQGQNLFSSKGVTHKEPNETLATLALETAFAKLPAPHLATIRKNDLFSNGHDLELDTKPSLLCHALWLGPSQWASGYCPSTATKEFNDQTCQLTISSCQCLIAD